jgi:uncharacterized membrane protein
MHTPDFRPPRLAPVAAALALATGLCLILLVIRAGLTNEIRWTAFFGNLLLAWIPFVLSIVLAREWDRPLSRRWVSVGLFALWVLFFPNCAYIVTDLIHLKTRPPVPRWFDYILITAYAWTGLFLGYGALRILQLRIQHWWGRWHGWLFAITMLGLASAGIYVGRFFRWNSWDPILRPQQIFGDLIRFTEWRTLGEALAFCAAFFLLSISIYLVVHAFTLWHPPARSAGGDASPGRVP